MAQPIYCAAEGCESPAVILQTQLETGETAGWCFQHYVTVCRAITDSVDQAERDEAAAEVARRLEHVSAPAGEGDGPTVVRRGTSRSRKAYEARRRAKGAEMDNQAAVATIARPGANLAGSEDPGDDDPTDDDEPADVRR